MDLLRVLTDYNILFCLYKGIDLNILEERINDAVNLETSKVPVGNNGDMTKEISKLLHDLGMPSHIKGYQYIRDSIALMYNNPDCLGGITKEVYPYISNLKNNDWTTSEYLDSFEIRNTIDCLLLVIPYDCEGALETVLLNAISENPYDKNIVDRCRNFVKDIKPEAEKYISSNRLRLKAELSVTWAIQSPQKVFDFIDEEIRSVKWENSALLNRCFCKLVEI